MIQYEKLMVENLIKEESIMSNVDFDERSDKLVFKVMSDKINEKYKDTLLPEQKDIIRNYAIYANDSDALEYYLSSVKSKTIKSLKEYKSVTDNKIILSKIGAVIKNIEGLQTESVDDKTISKYLTLVSLKNEIMRKEK